MFYTLSGKQRWKKKALKLMKSDLFRQKQQKQRAESPKG